jgi:hypothetical protein
LKKYLFERQKSTFGFFHPPNRQTGMLVIPFDQPAIPEGVASTEKDKDHLIFIKYTFDQAIIEQEQKRLSKKSTSAGSPPQIFHVQAQTTLHAHPEKSVPRHQSANTAPIQCILSSSQEIDLKIENTVHSNYPPVNDILTAPAAHSEGSQKPCAETSEAEVDNCRARAEGMEPVSTIYRSRPSIDGVTVFPTPTGEMLLSVDVVDGLFKISGNDCHV